jgi:hypothetical protein
MLRTILIFCTMFMAVGTANAEPLKLTDAQMDGVTAGGLLLPTPDTKEVFAGFDNPAPFDFHPNFDNDGGGGARSTTAAEYNDGAGGDSATAFKGPVNGLFGNEGPWSAHFASPVIDCSGC